MSPHLPVRLCMCEYISVWRRVGGVASVCFSSKDVLDREDKSCLCIYHCDFMRLQFAHCWFDRPQLLVSLEAVEIIVEEISECCLYATLEWLVDHCGAGRVGG
jgi:hypothetical protein